METIEKLIYEFYQLPKLYETIAKEAGDNFNLFELLVSRNNEAMHSKFIGQLLNPSASHGQGDIFLKLFVEYLNIQNFETENATLSLERFIGKVKITETEAEGGRIDILIQDKKGVCVVIENKINAHDQDAQLLRYYDFINKKDKEYKKSTLLYLNLFGNDAQKHSTKGEKFPYQIISYKKDILDWLRLCREKAANLPLLRESISQYINLIKSLTHQTNNAKMNNEIADSIVASPEKLTAYLNLVDNQAVKNAVYNKVLEPLKAALQKMADEKGLKLNWELSLDAKYCGFSFSNAQTDLYNIKIYYQCSASANILKNFIFGFFYIDKETAKRDRLAQIQNEKLEQIQKDFKEKFSSDLVSDWWPCYKAHTHKDWGEKEFEMVKNGEMAKLISAEVDKMLEIIDSIE